jgi:glycosyltransferase involved in cell wall biosynthesis
MRDRGTSSDAISVVICTYNRAESLRLTLESLIEPSRGQDTEIIVVDNNSDDHTREVARSFEDALPGLRYVHEPRRGLSRARNTGIRCASGDLIAFVDDDIVVDRRWLDTIRAAFSTHPADVVAGPIALASASFPAWWQEHFSLALGLLDLGDRPVLFSRGYQGTCGIGGNLCFRRHVFDRCGDFDVSLGRGAPLDMGEDMELCHRLLERSHSVLYFPPARVFHRCHAERLTKRYLRRWFFRYGEWCGFARRMVSNARRRDARFAERFEAMRLWLSSPFSSELAALWLAGYLRRWLVPAKHGGR